MWIIASFAGVISRLRFKLRLIALIGIVMSSAIVSGADFHKAGDIVIEPTTLSTPETGPIQFEMGTLYVPENRSDPKSRLIGLGFARFRGLRPTGAPPQFHLPGGPGSSWLIELKQGHRGLLGRFQFLALYRQAGDVVLVDQRGFSERGDVIKFGRPLLPEPLDKPRSLDVWIKGQKEAARAAITEYQSKGFDLRGYTVLEAADDVDDLRKALGYERITLVATSFGSKWSFAVMRRHPESVARALLSGVEPLNCSFDMPSEVMAAVQRMWWDAEQDPQLQPYLPPGGLMGAARGIVHRLERGPVEVKVNDKTGQSVTVTLGLSDFQFYFLGLSNPPSLLSIYYGHYEDWAKGTLASRRTPHSEGALIRPLMDTSLGATPLRLYRVRSDAATEFLGTWDSASDVASVGTWPTVDVGDDFRTPIVSRIPVVFVQGDWDTATPMENTLEIATFFHNSRVLIVNRGGHGVIPPLSWDINEDYPNVMAALLDYLRTGNMEDVPTRLSLAKFNFRVPNFPPPKEGPGSTGKQN